jgi:acetyl-CoA carboxylase carboxyltransferase component
MVWEPEIEELARRRALSAKGGTPDRIERQHNQGRLVVRERMEQLVDPGSLQEIGALAGEGTYEGTELTGFMPASYVMGLGKIDGRTVAIGGEDFTIQGGSSTARMQRSKGGLGGFVEDMALEYRIPLVLLIDGAGANIKAVAKMGHTYLPSSTSFARPVEVMQQVPVVAAVLGSVAGGPAGRAMLAHWNVMTRGTSDLFAAGPPVVQRALGHDVTKSQLGGSQVHVHQSGAIDNEAEDETDAFSQIRQFLSYMPANVWELPPVRATDDPLERTEEALLSIVPRNRKRPYNMRKLLRLVVDEGELFEIKPAFGTSVITTFARLGGRPVGLVANNPMQYGGALDADGADKQGHFLELCDYFRIPLIYFADIPGFMVGEQAEQHGTLRSGMRAIWTAMNATVPSMTVVIRKVYGMGGMATGNAKRLNYRIAWPSGEWGSIPIEGGVEAAYRREIAAADDPAQRREEIEAGLRSMRSVFRTAESFGVEEIIDPRETRRYLCQFAELAYGSMNHDLGPKPMIGVRP